MCKNVKNSRGLKLLQGSTYLQHEAAIFGVVVNCVLNNVILLLKQFILYLLLITTIYANKYSTTSKHSPQ